MSLSENIFQNMEALNQETLLKRKDPLSKARKEYKFLIPLTKIPEVFEFLNENYAYSTHEEGGIYKYESTYFDTEHNQFFTLHRQEKPNRMKVRIREYKSGVKGAFVECKKKHKGTYTHKDRNKITEISAKALEEPAITSNLQKYGLTPKDLEQKVHISYKRIFLIAKDFSKRITIDFDIETTHKDGSVKQIIPNYCVFEIKEEGIPKEIMRYLRKNHKIHRQGFSKYCIAICTLDPTIKSNKWKQTLKYNHA